MIMQPRSSMLKFRLPWNNRETEYLDGDIRLPIWGPTATTESRLITPLNDPGSKKLYDNTKYEQQMMNFNVHTRVALYNHNVPGQHVDGDDLCHCFDCASEVRVIMMHA
jgi:cap2 methyltransferase